MVAGRSQNMTTVCGWVNGKNSFGGYTGDQPYIGGLVSAGEASVFVVTAFGSDQFRASMVAGKCRKAGIQLPAR
jgi:hypothetical protein